MAYITTADIAARMPEDAYVRLFDRDDDGRVVGSTDLAFVNVCIDTAQSVVDTELGDAFPEPLDANGKVVDPRVKAAHVQIAIYEAVRYSPLSSGDGQSPYRKGFEDALEMLRRIRTDQIRLRTSNGGNAPPRTRRQASQGAISDAGAPNNPYTRNRDGRDGTDF